MIITLLHKHFSLLAVLGLMAAAVLLFAGTLVVTENAMAAVLRVYWTDRDNGTLLVTDLSSGATQVLAQNIARPQDVDLDTSTGILYFADWGPPGPPGNEGSINQVNKDGTGLMTVLNTGDGVHQLALDEVNQLIYFTRAVSYDNHEISVVNYAGDLGSYVTLLSGGRSGPGWFPSGLALDSVNNLLYWGDPGFFNNPPGGSVNSMGTDGSAPTQLTPHVSFPLPGRGRGYALDQASQTIFLTAHLQPNPGAGGELFSYDIATNTETLLISDHDTGYWDVEIDPVDQRIWWTDYGRGQIRSAKFDGSDVSIELSNLTNPYGLALEIIEEQRVVFLVIDEDSIDKDNAPNFFSDTDVNDDIADIGVRGQLPFFAANVGSTITLHTGEVGDEGMFAPKTIPDSWNAAGPTTDGLRNYLDAGPGLGSPDAEGDREALLDKIPDVIRLRADGLALLEGRVVCGVAYDSDISINYGPIDGSLKGANLGTVAFKVLEVTKLEGFSSSSLPEVDIEILDADEVCEGELVLFTDAPEPTSSSEPFDIEP